MSKIIEARAIISAEDRLSKVLDGIGKKFKDFGKGIKVGANLDGLNKSLAGTQKQLEALERIKSAQGRLSNTKYNLGGLKEQADRINAALAAARKAGDASGAKDLVGQSKAAQRALAQTNTAIERQAQVLRDARQAFNQLGVPVSDLVGHERKLKASIDQTTASLNKQVAADKRRQEMVERAAARTQGRKDAISGLTATAGVLAAHKGKAIGMEAIQSAADFDIAVRKQRVFTDITGQDQSGLLEQAKRVGQETQFSNIDVVKAQTAAMQGLPSGFGPSLKAEVAKGIVENVRNYATLMETDLKEGAETIRSYLQATGKDISTKEKALAEANKATNQIVKMAKLGGMNGEDASQFIKYAASAATSSGLTTETTMSLGALARRGGLRGDEAGTFIKATAGKLVDPTQKGLAALNAAGVNYSDYVKMPDQLSTARLEGQFQTTTGKTFTPDVRSKLDEINADKTLIADRAKYVAAVTSAVEPILGKKKDGTVRASDAQVAAKAASNFHRVSAQSVDAEALLDAMMKANPTLAQLNAILTGKHGGKGAITQRQWDEFKSSREDIKKSGDDPDFAKKRADEVMAGLGGSVENLKGSWENLVLSIGTANEGLIKFAADGIGKGIDAFSNLSTSSQQILSLLGGGAAAGGGIYGALKFMGAIFGTGGGAVALTGSATALDGAAAALTAAAVKLGGGGVSDMAAKMGAAAAPGAAATATFGLGGAAVLGGAIGGAALDSATPGTGPGVIGALTGEISSLTQTFKALRTERESLDAARVAGGVGLGGAKTLPGSPGAAAGYVSSYQGSRGALGDFLLGKKTESQQLPGFGGGRGSMQMPAGPITAEVKSMPPLSGEVTGTGTLTATVTVTPSPLLTTTITGLERAVLELKGKVSSIGSNGPGSTGKSSPDAGKGGKD
jgi:TP901 family phage tail tape measure protein